MLKNKTEETKDGKIDLKQIVKEVEENGMRCNCDLDTWEPEPNTGHSFVCHIHKTALEIRSHGKA